MKTDVEPALTDSPDHASGPAPMRRNRLALRIVVSSALVLLFLAVGGAIARVLVLTQPEAERTEFTARVPMVEVQRLLFEEVQEFFVGYGSARPDREALISAEVSGQVVHAPEHVRDGAVVQEGETLIRIDDRQYRRRLDKAAGELADAEAMLGRLDVELSNIDQLIAIAKNEVAVTKGEYQRLTRLHESGTASKKEWDFGRLAYERSNREMQGLLNERELFPSRRASMSAIRDSRKADVELAELDIERCTIRAPFSGQLSLVMVDVGDRVQVGFGDGGAIARLVGTRYIEIPVELPLSVRPKTRAQARCTLRMDSMPGVEWSAVVRRLSPMADAASRTFTAYVVVDNEKQHTPLVPGYFLTARVEGPLISKALVIPRGAIIRDHVFVVNDNAAHSRLIRVEALVGDRAVVSGELAEGDRVILTNLDVLHDGAPVRLRDDDDTARPTTAHAVNGQE